MIIYCPKCGGETTLSFNQKYATCNYCGHRFRHGIPREVINEQEIVALHKKIKSKEKIVKGLEESIEMTSKKASLPGPGTAIGYFFLTPVIWFLACLIPLMCRLESLIEIITLIAVCYMASRVIYVIYWVIVCPSARDKTRLLQKDLNKVNCEISNYRNTIRELSSNR